MEESDRQRRYLINYNHVMARIFELLDRADLAIHLPPLKTKSKRARLDQLWRHICDRNRWPFVTDSPYPPHIIASLFPDSIDSVPFS